MNIYTEKYGYLTDIQRMTINEYHSMNIRYMFSAMEKVNGQQTEINVYENRETADLYYIPEQEIADWLKEQEAIVC